MNTIVEKIRAEFPALSVESHGSKIVYLDNAATSQKPRSVIDFIAKSNAEQNANVHRAAYELSEKATILYEAARESVREFINAPDRKNIIFTSGTTAAINLVASSFCQKFLQSGDSILITADSHHSNIVPWQLAAERAGAKIRVLPFDKWGRLCLEELDNLLDSSVKIVACTHISNVIGVVNPIAEIIHKAHKKNIPVLVDGAQGVVHCKVDVQDLDCDFYTFSFHKLYGATGSGILYGKEELLEKMPPYMGGGDMVDTVTFEKTTYAELPLKFEAGTPNISGASSFLPAEEFVSATRGEGEDYFAGVPNSEIKKAVESEQNEIVDYLFHALHEEVKDIDIYGDTTKGSTLSRADKIPLISFNIRGCNSGDVAQILDQFSIAVRSGMMCAEPLLNNFGVTGAVRVSFAPYNTLDEARYFISSLKRTKQMLF